MAFRYTAGNPRVFPHHPGEALFLDLERHHESRHRRWVPADDLPTLGKMAFASGYGPCCRCCGSRHVWRRRNGGRKPRTHRDRR